MCISLGTYKKCVIRNPSVVAMQGVPKYEKRNRGGEDKHVLAWIQGEKLQVFRPGESIKVWSRDYCSKPARIYVYPGISGDFPHHSIDRRNQSRRLNSKCKINVTEDGTVVCYDFEWNLFFLIAYNLVLGTLLLCYFRLLFKTVPKEDAKVQSKLCFRCHGTSNRSFSFAYVLV